jgi:MFS family permease
MDSQTARRATILIMAMFVVQPLAIGGWLALIPYVKESLGLSKGELAFALLGMPLALIPTLQIAGGLVGRFGLRHIFQIIFPIQSAALMLPLFAWNGISLFFALACIGAAAAFLEVGLNVYAGRLEKKSGLLIMNRCHGFWALGITLGSALVALLADVSPFIPLGVLAAVSTVAGIAIARMMPRLVEANEGPAAPRRKIRELPMALFMIAGTMFFVTMAEGAMADWAAVYLSERMGGVDASAGLAVTIFSAFLAGGRFIGDWMKRHMGAVMMGRFTLSCAILGLLLLVLPLPLAFAYPGFALVGFGVSAGFPLGVSAVAELDDDYEAPNIAVMAQVALCGFLVGPPLIGTIAEATSLSFGLAALLPGLVLAMVLMRWLGRPESVKKSPESAPESG